jgi:hypothetical protein
MALPTPCWGTLTSSRTPRSTTCTRQAASWSPSALGERAWGPPIQAVLCGDLGEQRCSRVCVWGPVRYIPRLLLGPDADKKDKDLNIDPAWIAWVPTALTSTYAAVQVGASRWPGRRRGSAHAPWCLLLHAPRGSRKACRHFPSLPHPCLVSIAVGRARSPSSPTLPSPCSSVSPLLAPWTTSSCHLRYARSAGPGAALRRLAACLALVRAPPSLPLPRVV